MSTSPDNKFQAEPAGASDESLLQVHAKLQSQKPEKPNGYSLTPLVLLGIMCTAIFFGSIYMAHYSIRFDPLDGTGEFRIEAFDAQSVTGPRGWVAALSNKLGLLFRYQCAGRVLSRGASDLLHGRFSRVRRKLFQGLHDARTLRSAGPVDFDEYADWRRRRALTDADREQLRAEAAALADPPVISVLMPVCDPPVECLREAIDSVRV